MAVRGTVLALLLLVLCAAPVTAAAADGGHWESRPAAPLPRQESAFAELDGKLYFAGGFEHGGAESARHEVYDVATGTWSVATPLPEPIHHAAGVGLGGRVYYVGGLQTLAFAPTGRVWAYDPASGLWEQKASLPPGRERGAGAIAVHDGRIVYVGGARIVVQDNRPRRVAVGQVDVYDPATDTWSALPDMPTPRDHFGVGVVGDTLYAVGGRQITPALPVRATEALDLRTREWRTGLAQIPTARGGFATAVLGGQIVTAGGENPMQNAPTLLHVHAHDEVESYDPAADAWRPLARMPFGRYGIQGAAHDGGLWVAGGGAGLTVDATAALEVFFPAGRATARAARDRAPVATSAGTTRR